VGHAYGGAVIGAIREEQHVELPAGSKKAHDEPEKLRVEYLKAEKVSETDADDGA
jgi:hypothetical protein